MFHPLLEKLNSMRVILATSSKQRQAILHNTQLKFEICPSAYEESLDRQKYSISDYVIETALGKVNDVTNKLKNDEKSPDIIIGLDTMVYFNGKMFGKPKSSEDALETLKLFTNSDFPHSIHTGVVIFYKGQIEKFVEVTQVHMSKISDEDLEAYVRTGEPMGKAGSYAIQGLAASFVQKIEGDYNNVIGLPLCAITNKLKEFVSREIN